ncbi:MAG: cation-transporting P-type ATPase [Candidatus Nomurabacteria bacterium]|nr:MAG: cation-transporting P-type ATPase [Candidatus Nomurabacteria bacterium]
MAKSTQDKIDETKGLSSQQVRAQRARYGENTLAVGKRVSPVQIFFRQFTSPLVVVLLIAALISGALSFSPGHSDIRLDAILIVIIVIISGVAGFIQEYKSEQSVQALRKIAAPEARVIRDGVERVISADRIVPGDIVVLQEGDNVPADMTLLKSQELMVNESMLTGESAAVARYQQHEVAMGTFVTSGNAIGRVERIGMKTRMGEIAERLNVLEDGNSPFHQEIDQFSRRAVRFVLILLVLFALISLLKYDVLDAIFIAISLAVAAIPEGLPAVLTLVMTMGARDMAQHKALIRRLSAVESIGAVSVIGTDKTGTLTKNEMSVTALATVHGIFDADAADQKNIPELLTGMLINNNARKGKNRDGQEAYLGDQIEIALLKFAERFPASRERIQKSLKRVHEIPFTSDRMMMSIIARAKQDKQLLVYTKGAPEQILQRCTQVLLGDKVQKISAAQRKIITQQITQLSSQGLRMLGFARASAKDANKAEEKNMTWVGLVAVIDPPREEVKDAVAQCRQAGIRVVMITGDSALTAQAIAQRVQLTSNGAIEGAQLDSMSDAQLRRALQGGVNIFARTSPLQKIRIMEALQKDGNVAMTGDGVNDALALKRADVGIAMGKSGTAVAREASDIILLDDNFVTIQSAVREGRRIFENIQKFINYLLTSNVAEIAVLFIAAVALPFSEPILLPVHILWINLLTDGLPAIALGVDPARSDIMKDPPRRASSILTRQLWWLVAVIGTKKTIILLATFLITLPLGFDTARTTLFTGFVLYEFVRIGTIRSQEKLGWFSNPWLVLALGASVLLQLLLIYTPLRDAFHLVALGFTPWLVLIAGVSIGYISAIGLSRLVLRYVREE